jgi:hypothetical protein
MSSKSEAVLMGHLLTAQENIITLQVISTEVLHLKVHAALKTEQYCNKLAKSVEERRHETSGRADAHTFRLSYGIQTFIAVFTHSPPLDPKHSQPNSVNTQYFFKISSVYSPHLQLDLQNWPFYSKLSYLKTKSRTLGHHHNHQGLSPFIPSDWNLYFIRFFFTSFFRKCLHFLHTGLCCILHSFNTPVTIVSHIPYPRAEW